MLILPTKWGEQQLSNIKKKNMEIPEDFPEKIENPTRWLHALGPCPWPKEMDSKRFNIPSLGGNTMGIPWDPWDLSTISQSALNACI